MAEKIVLNLTNYKEMVGARIPEGTYRAVVEDVEVGKSKKGSGMLTVWLRVQGGDHDGATIIDRLMLEGNAMFRTVNFLGGMGIPTPRKQFSLDTAKFLNRPVDIQVVDSEPYNGNVTSNVSSYAKVSKSAVQASNDVEDLDDVEEVEPGDSVEDSTPTVEESPTPAKASKETEGEIITEENDDVDLEELDEI